MVNDPRPAPTWPAVLLLLCVLTMPQMAENLSWFKEHLNTLRTHAHSSKVNTSLYVTRAPPDHQHHLRPIRSMSSESSSDPSPPVSPDAADMEKMLSPQQSLPKTARPTPSSGDIEKELEQFQEHHSEYKSAAPESGNTDHPMPDFRHHIKAGRPDVASLIRDAVNSTPQDQRVLVAACGPAGLMRVVRNTTASLIRGDGPGVELHCEQFGW
jgi:hypothetical protein